MVDEPPATQGFAAPAPAVVQWIRERAQAPGLCGGQSPPNRTSLGVARGRLDGAFGSPPESRRRACASLGGRDPPDIAGGLAFDPGQDDELPTLSEPQLTLSQQTRDQSHGVPFGVFVEELLLEEILEVQGIEDLHHGSLVKQIHSAGTATRDLEVVVQLEPRLATDRMD